jgi:PIN domain nuclease of toxin-antitoxin system
VRALLDTHAAYWYAVDDPSLSATARAFIQNATNNLLVSPASYWEMAIKAHTGKWQLLVPYDQLVESPFTVYGFGHLPILPAHTFRLIGLPDHHKDPFDRLLIAQALAEGIPVVSVDTRFDLYGVTRIW